MTKRKSRLKVPREPQIRDKQSQNLISRRLFQQPAKALRRRAPCTRWAEGRLQFLRQLDEARRQSRRNRNRGMVGQAVAVSGDFEISRNLWDRDARDGHAVSLGWTGYNAPISNSTSRCPREDIIMYGRRGPWRTTGGLGYIEGMPIWGALRDHEVGSCTKIREHI